jgi:hypothetical protein
VRFDCAISVKDAESSSYWKRGNTYKLSKSEGNLDRFQIPTPMSIKRSIIGGTLQTPGKPFFLVFFLAAAIGW